MASEVARIYKTNCLWNIPYAMIGLIEVIRGKRHA